ncbi:hypothetical protein EBB59_12160 [Lysobacter pythonis]|uniref:Uncharacterized protein n=1 Tax=Solilutibacter pythonis TaxID=2483112 RepID=A0A3M2HKK6_9GAMM|nr:hypothetical protein EBB59_12160 [Lysobacter pythonis]
MAAAAAGIATQSWSGAAKGAFTAALTFGIGYGVASDIAQIAAQAVTGGVMEWLQGGQFGSGFLSAGLTAAFMPQVGRIGNDMGRIVTGALVGGTISEVTGGKFANGAASGAIQAAMMGGDQVKAGIPTQFLVHLKVGTLPVLILRKCRLVSGCYMIDILSFK